MKLEESNRKKGIRKYLFFLLVFTNSRENGVREAHTGEAKGKTGNSR